MQNKKNILDRMRLWKSLVFYFFCFLFIVLTSIGYLILQIENERNFALISEKVSSELAEIKAQIESRLYSNIHKAESIKPLVAMKPDLTVEDFNRAMDIYFQDQHDLRNVSLAPNMIISYMYPIKGNEAALGLDFRTIPDQFATADLARKLNKIVVAGPLELVQGGLAIVARVPIFLSDNEKTSDNFWGLASVVIDMDKLLEGIGFFNSTLEIDIAFRGKDGMGSKGEMFFGREEVFNLNPIIMNIDLPHGYWQIAAIPLDGWTKQRFILNRFTISYLISAIILLSMAFLLILIVQRMNLAEAKATRAAKAKSEFLANMSHEIRTPLNGVIGFTKLLRNTPLNETQKLYVNNAHSSAHSLLDIINDILDFSKIEAKKLDLDPVKTDIKELIINATNIISFMVSQKNIDLIVNISENVPRFALFDPVRLKQILINLLNNAAKFTSEGEIEFKLTFRKIENRQGKFSFAVRDTGIGITEEQKGKLFKAFSQADTSITRKYGGTGLGLIIANSLAQKMGSSIEFSSEAGVGSTFYFTIVTEFYQETQEDAGQFDMEEKNYDNPESPKETLVPLNQREDAANLVILIVEDVKLNVNLLRILLKNILNNLVILEAHNGLEGIEILENNHVDLILMDVQMPEMDGLEATRIIRRNTVNQQTPIIALTAGSTTEDKEKCFNAGMNDYLVKPIDEEKLKIIINKYLSKKVNVT